MSSDFVVPSDLANPLWRPVYWFKSPRLVEFEIYNHDKHLNYTHCNNLHQSENYYLSGFVVPFTLANPIPIHLILGTVVDNS